MAGAIHRILLGNQEAAATWLPFAMGQFYACPEGAQTSFTPVPGVTILVKRVGGQDVVQITAGGDPDFVVLDNVNPTTAFTIPKQFTPNYPNLQPKSPSFAYLSRLYGLGGSRLFSVSGRIDKNPDTGQNMYSEHLYTWGWNGTWFYPISHLPGVPKPFGFFDLRDPLIISDCTYSPTPTAPPSKRLVAIESQDDSGSVPKPGLIYVSDDLGATWAGYRYPPVPVKNTRWFNYSLDRVDVDKLIYTIYTLRAGSSGRLHFYVAGSGATAWGRIEGFFQTPPDTSPWINSASFYPGNTAGVVNGLATMDGLPDLPPTAILRTIRSTDSCSTFTYTDVVLTLPPADTGSIDHPVIGRIHPDPDDKDTYAALWMLSDPVNQGGGMSHAFISLAYTKDNGLSWQYSPITEIWTETGDGVDSFAVDSYGFYQGAFYFYAGNNGPSLRRLYFTKDLGQTWDYTRCSNTTGRGVSQSVQLFKNGLAYPHRSDMA